jgi:hypothetical protein
MICCNFNIINFSYFEIALEKDIQHCFSTDIPSETISRLQEIVKNGNSGGDSGDGVITTCAWAVRALTNMRSIHPLIVHVHILILL